MIIKIQNTTQNGPIPHPEVGWRSREITAAAVGNAVYGRITRAGRNLLQSTNHWKPDRCWETLKREREITRSEPGEVRDI